MNLPPINSNAVRIEEITFSGSKGTCVISKGQIFTRTYPSAPGAVVYSMLSQNQSVCLPFEGVSNVSVGDVGQAPVYVRITSQSTRATPTLQVDAVWDETSNKTVLFASIRYDDLPVSDALVKARVQPLDEFNVPMEVSLVDDGNYSLQHKFIKDKLVVNQTWDVNKGDGIYTAVVSYGKPAMVYFEVKNTNDTYSISPQFEATNGTTWNTLTVPSKDHVSVSPFALKATKYLLPEKRSTENELLFYKPKTTTRPTTTQPTTTSAATTTQPTTTSAATTTQPTTTSTATTTQPTTTSAATTTQPTTTSAATTTRPTTTLPPTTSVATTTLPPSGASQTTRKPAVTTTGTTTNQLKGVSDWMWIIISMIGIIISLMFGCFLCRCFFHRALQKNKSLA